MKAGRLKDRVTILQRSETQDSTYGTASLTWTTLATVWAEVQDILPSRAEGIADGINIARRPCRVRMRYRTDINSTMRLSFDGRTLRIIGGPAEIGFHEGIELVAEELTTSGDEP